MIIVTLRRAVGALSLVGAALSMLGCAGVITPTGDGGAAERAHEAARGATDMLTLVPETDPWGGAVMRHQDGRTLLGAALHADGLLGVWQINPDRSVTRVGGLLDAGYHPDSVAVWDDRRFVVAAEGIGKLQLWEIDGDRVHKTDEINSPFGVRDLLVVDLDLDGNLDVVMSPFDGSRLAIFWGDGGFRFSRQQFIHAGASAPWHPIAVDWTDDGHPDLIWGPLDGRSVNLARNRGGRVFEFEQLQRVRGFNPRHLAIGDVTQNGLSDIVVAVEGGPAAVLVRQPDGSHEHREIPPVEVDYVSAAVMKDGTILLADEMRVVLVRVLDESFESFDKRWLPAGSLPSPMDLYDLDGDGHEDVIVYNSGRGGITIHFGPLWDAANRFE